MHFGEVPQNTVPMWKQAEQYVAGLIGGVCAAGNARYDLTQPLTGFRFEVKYSKLVVPVQGGKSRRWQWRRLKGDAGRKSYNRLILIGEADPRYSCAFPDWDFDLGTPAPYVIFDVPFNDVDSMVDGQKMISLSTHPFKSRLPVARRLFDEFRVTRTQLSKRYNCGIE